jgi:hypothetical protein
MYRTSLTICVLVAHSVGQWAGRQGIGVRIPEEATNFYSLLFVQAGFGAHLASCPVNLVDSFPEIKQPVREADTHLV